MTAATTQISDYTKTVFTAETRQGHTVSHDIYHRGSGTPVVLIQELPGVGQETLALADRLVDAGHEVVMPHLFGPIGRTSIGGNLVRVLCLRKEFSVLAANRSSPIVDWLRLLCHDVRQSRGVARGRRHRYVPHWQLRHLADCRTIASLRLSPHNPAMPFFKQGALHMSAKDVTDVRNALDEKRSHASTQI
jgi:hypothetical protein